MNSKSAFEYCKYKYIEAVSFDLVPRWRNLHHFKSVMNITFNDGSKNKDISKVMSILSQRYEQFLIVDKVFLFASQAIFSHNRNSEGYYLLRCLRKYLNARMYSDFNLHTESTLRALTYELEQNFYPLLSVSTLKQIHFF
jgi:hypothetical protein